ncbi:MAG: KamA family radical SAM protein [Candidatus Paceibacterota bacterium]|jgi:lysine 2,3-aminomutase|nr:KamA family radical SAM protein [Candidatus Paceibacterota bacterium]
MNQSNLQFKITPHLEKLAKKSEAIRKQFYPSRKEKQGKKKNLDPLAEEKNSPVKGLIYRYSDRALVLLTLNCAAYCRFCFRRRAVSDIGKGLLRRTDLEAIVDFIKKHKKIREVIISGGDPLTQPEILRNFLKKIVCLKQIKIIRIGTRLAVSDPKRINQEILEILKLVKKQPLYLLLHFEHPDELTLETKKAIKKLHSLENTILLSQTVFLKGINDKKEILKELFEGLTALGVKPYYIFHNDAPSGTEHFTVGFKKEIKIMTQLRKELSGLAYPIYALDKKGFPCKIPLPLDFDFSFLRQSETKRQST